MLDMRPVAEAMRATLTTRGDRVGNVVDALFALAEAGEHLAAAISADRPKVPFRVTDEANASDGFPSARYVQKPTDGS